MHSKDNNKLKNFIQGLRPFSSAIPKTLKKHLKKGGYNCISQVTLKIVQEKIKPKQNEFLKIKDISKINEKINKVDNNQLKNSLNNFLKAFNEKNK